MRDFLCFLLARRNDISHQFCIEIHQNRLGELACGVKKQARAVTLAELVCNSLEQSTTKELGIIHWTVDDQVAQKPGSIICSYILPKQPHDGLVQRLRAMLADEIVGDLHR